MDSAHYQRVLARLPAGRTLFYWFDDRDALEVLSWAAGDGAEVRALRASSHGALLTRPGVRARPAAHGRRVVSAADLAGHWPERHFAYRIGFDRWPREGERPKRRWHQITRSGVNLVVQLNFPLSHNQSRSPPRSIYTALPRRCGFQRTHNPPAFLLADKSRRLQRLLRDPRTRWWVLET